MTANTYTWNGGNVAYASPDQWTPNGVPDGVGDVAIINAGSADATSLTLTGVTIDIGALGVLPYLIFANGTLGAGSVIENVAQPHAPGEIFGGFENEGTIAAVSGGTLDLAAPGTFTNDGTISITGGARLNFFCANLIDTVVGHISVDDGIAAINADSIDFGGNATATGPTSVFDLNLHGTGSISGSGTITISAGGYVEDDCPATSGVTFDFADGSSDRLLIAPYTPSGFTARIQDFQPGNYIRMQGIIVDEARWSDSVLTLSNKGTFVTSLEMTSSLTDYAHVNFIVSPFQQLGSPTFTYLSIACFAMGTRITTESGATPVEMLRVGDRAVSAFGGTVPIVWIGHRYVDCRSHPRPRDVWPVRVTAGAFGPGLPVRDLLLSPDHAVFARDVLIPIRHLINGTTIAQEAKDHITYFHVELPSHDVIFAEDLPTESYLDTGNRNSFANDTSVVQIHPKFAGSVWQSQACAPLILFGPKLTAAKASLLARADELGYVLSDEPELRLLVDGVAVMPTQREVGYHFVVPPGARIGKLMSRVFVPAQVHAASEDHRQLGVAVARLLLDGCQPRLGDGWHLPEPDFSWTKGCADIVLDGGRELTLDIAMSGARYYSGHDSLQRRVERGLAANG